MCGRFSLRRLPEAWQDTLGLGSVSGLKPRYNIAPGQPVLAVAHDEEENRNLLRYFDWGLLPSWQADDRHRPINARAETAHLKPYFRAAMRHRRCLVPADGFYEWSGRGPGRRPYYFQMSDAEPFAFAGLWEHWEGPQGEHRDTLAILTTTPNDLVSPLHHRMPVILDQHNFQRWIDPALQSAAEVQDLLHPQPAERMQVMAVTPYVNNPLNEGPTCVQPDTTDLFGPAP